MSFDNLSIEDNNSNSLLVTFGGIKQGMGMPVYEFYNSLKTIKCDKVFIKDIYQAWYHKGINEDINNIAKLKELLKSIIEKKVYTKVVFIGNSMGGYGAILFGVLLNIDKVIAFSPQTFIDRMNRFWYKDNRWSNEITNVYLNNSNQKRFYDLNTYLKKKSYSTKIDVYYSKNDKLDCYHSQKLNKQSNIRFYSFDKGNHNLIKVLRDDGELITIIYNAINK